MENRMDKQQTRTERLARIAANIACVIIAFLLLFPLVSRFVL